MIKCDQCESENREDKRFCGNCGTSLSRVCPDCKSLNEPVAHYCGECGKSLNVTGLKENKSFVPAQIPVPENLQEKIKSSRTSMEGERKQVTVLFADIKDYTPLAEYLGEEKIFDIMGRVYERMMDAVHQHEGTVQELTGDGILALFGAPISLEDAPVRACRAALEIQQQMNELGVVIKSEYGEHLRVRIGVHTGLVVVGTLGSDLRMEFKAVGDTVNTASRLESMAEPETILISDVTHRLVNAYANCIYVGDLKIKGKAETQQCYKLLGMKAVSERFGASLQRGLTPLVGLSQELQVLKQKLKQAQQGQNVTVDIVGEAGSGKSRLLYEFKQFLQTEDVQILQMQCSLYGRSTAFFPVVAMLRALFQLQEGMNQEEIEARISEALNQYGLESQDMLPLLLNLLGIAVRTDYFRGLDAEIIGARTRDALKELFEAYHHNATALILIEDLHWLDSATEALLQSFIKADQTSGSFILNNYRPEYVSPWNGEHKVTILELSPLTGENSLQLVRHCLGLYAKSEDLVQSVVRRVEGNPLFAEELSHYLQDAAGSEQINRVFSVDDGIDGLLPESLRDLIMARIDRLEEQPRELLQMMSVVGREFPLNLIEHLWSRSNALPELIDVIESTGLISGLEQDNGKTFLFRHALIQEAVYESLLAPRCAILHGRVAQAIEELHTEYSGEHAATLAYHWKKSTQPNKAIPFLTMAGEKNLGVYSLEEADHWFQQALEQMDASLNYEEDTLLAEVLLGWVRVHYYRKDFRGLIRILERHLERIESLNDPRSLSLTLFWLGLSHYFATRYDISKVLLNRALKLGKQLDDTECIGYACLGLLFIGVNVEAESSEESIEQLGSEVLAAASHLSDAYLESKYCLCMTIHTIYMGRYSDAENFCLRMRQLGERFNDPRAIAMSHWSLSFVNIFQNQFEEALENAEASQQCSPDPLDKLMASAARGTALALMGDSKEGAQLLHEVRREMVEVDYLAPLLGIDIPYGAAMALAGEMRAGIKWIQDSIERYTRAGNLSQPAVGNLVLGEIYLQMALGEEKPALSIMIRNLGFILLSLPVAARKARQYLEQAVSECRKIDTPATLARALMDLALLNQKQKRFDEAQACLAEASAIAKPQAPVLYAKITQLQQCHALKNHS